MPDLPARVLVLGLARSGRAAVAALRRSGVEVVAHDASTDVDASGVDADVHLGEWSDALLDGIGLVVKSPGVPAGAPPSPPRARDRSRSSPRSSWERDCCRTR